MNCNQYSYLYNVFHQKLNNKKSSTIVSSFLPFLQLKTSNTTMYIIVWIHFLSLCLHYVHPYSLSISIPFFWIVLRKSMGMHSQHFPYIFIYVITLGLARMHFVCFCAVLQCICLQTCVQKIVHAEIARLVGQKY